MTIKKFASYIIPIMVVSVSVFFITKAYYNEKHEEPVVKYRSPTPEEMKVVRSNLEQKAEQPDQEKVGNITGNSNKSAKVGNITGNSNKSANANGAKVMSVDNGKVNDANLKTPIAENNLASETQQLNAKASTNEVKKKPDKKQIGVNELLEMAHSLPLPHSKDLGNGIVYDPRKARVVTPSVTPNFTTSVEDIKKSIREAEKVLETVNDPNLKAFLTRYVNSLKSAVNP